MESSFFFARLIGIFALVMSASMLLRKKMLTKIFHDLSENRVLSYILGTLLFIIGLLMVLNHTIWIWGFQLVITFLGWMILLEGAFFLLASSKMVKRYLRTMENASVYHIIVFAYLVLGIYMFYIGFLHNE